jgi:beta-phosphoglucomutase family hydrolase
MLGLPPEVGVCLFDMDGVLTQTAIVHAAAWKRTFDEFLKRWSAAHGQPFVPFDEGADYNAYVDGLPREQGVRSFLASRGIQLPDGSPADGSDADTVAGLGERKNALVVQLIAEGGVKVYEGSVRYVKAAREAGLRTAVVSSSANTHAVLESAGIGDLFDAVMDGIRAREEGLTGKPAPDTFVAAGRGLGFEPAAGAVFEDALAGVEAGRAGGFGIVVGVDRVGHAQGLREHGADVVVGQRLQAQQQASREQR